MSRPHISGYWIFSSLFFDDDDQIDDDDDDDDFGGVNHPLKGWVNCLSTLSNAGFKRGRLVDTRKLGQ